VLLKGKEVDVSNVGRAVAHGIAYVTEDRKGYGLLLDDDIARNISLANLPACRSRGVIDEGREFGVADGYRRSCASAAPACTSRPASCPAATSRRWCWASGCSRSPRC
jgi:ABC-type sugar transport system ATPase subunit